MGCFLTLGTLSACAKRESNHRDINAFPPLYEVERGTKGVST
jgi:hypothetical protein